MNWEELKKFIEQEKTSQTEDYKNFIKGIIENGIDDEFLKSNEKIVKYVKSQQDSHFDKGLETWKANNLEKLIQAEILKRNPAKTPQELEFEKLRMEFDQMKSEKAKAENLAKFKDELVKKNIPLELADLLISDDADVTKANLEIFENSMKTYVSGKLDEKLGERTDRKDKTSGDAIDKPINRTELANKTRLIKE